MTKYIRNFVSGSGIKFEVNKRNVEAFQKSSIKWQEISSGLDLSRESIVLLCGAKNNGKSSLGRHIINQFIGLDSTKQIGEANVDGDEVEENQPRVKAKSDKYFYFVDFDPGQPEMTTPGIVSAHLIRATDRPLQSPTYLNLNNHESIVMCSVGGTNMSVNPRMYIDCCRYVLARVLEHREQQQTKMPIYINTMGHIRNVGLAMLIDLIKISKPTNLIVLNVDGDPMRTVYADLSPQALANSRASFYYETTDAQKELLNYKYDVYNLDFMFVDSSSTATKNRTALQLAYIATVPDALYKPIMQLDAKWLSFEKISIYCVSSYPLKSNIVLELLYRSWVHLTKLKVQKFRKPPAQTITTTKIIASSTTSEQRDEQEPCQTDIDCNIIDDVGENQLFGCGIVIDIDVEHRKLAIITPLSQEILENHVNCIIKPLSIQVPNV